MRSGPSVGGMRQHKNLMTRLAVGAAATVFVAAAYAASASEPAQALEDVQIGESGSILRVALICTQRCEVAPGEGLEFRIVGVEANLDIDLAARSALARRLTIVRADGASILKIDAAARVNAARVVACQSDSGPAPCLEYRFDASTTAVAPDPVLRADPAPKAEARAPTLKKPKKDDVPFIGVLVAPSRPALREAPAGVLHLPQFGPPERLGAPDDRQSALGDLPAKLDVGRPALIAVDRAQTLGGGAAFDFMTEAVAILGKSFDIGACEGAKQRLAADAWALDAMIDHAFCKAADGDMDEADADFERLLAYTPDNYEALVGRGLIATARGDRERGQALFQEALNALPPIEESDRIVSAMGRN